MCAVESYRFHNGPLSYGLITIGKCGSEERPNEVIAVLTVAQGKNKPLESNCYPPGAEIHPAESMPVATKLDEDGSILIDIGKSTNYPDRVSLIAFGKTSVAVYQGMKRYCEKFCADTEQECGNFARYKPLSPVKFSEPPLAVIGEYHDLTFEPVGKLRPLQEEIVYDQIQPKDAKQISENQCAKNVFGQLRVIQCGDQLGLIVDDQGSIVFRSEPDYGAGLVRPIGTIMFGKHRAYLFEIGLKGRSAYAYFYFNGAKSGKWSFLYYKLDFPFTC